MMRPSLRAHETQFVARGMFFCGFAFLPLLHAVNVLFFRDGLKSGKLPPETRKWVIFSFTSAVISTALCIMWVVLFQTSWTTWPWATTIMFSVPDSELTGW
ncbi:unnamed protein product [Ascophyllum nodosum]